MSLSYKPKKIFIPGGKVEDLWLVRAAHRLGFYVITSGYNADAPAHKESDKYIKADYADKEEMLKIAKAENIDYMCSCANDFGMISTAYVCEQLGLPGHDSYETTLTIHHKDRFKPLAKKLGLHSPVSEILVSKEAALDYVKKTPGKIVLKPVDNVASAGVSIVETIDEKIAAIDYAFSKTRVGHILAEPCVEGFFVPVTSMIIDQKVVAFFATADLSYPQGKTHLPPIPISNLTNGSLNPSPFMEEFAPAIIEDFNKIARELHLVDGKFHAELLIQKDHTAQIFDVHRRSSGGAAPGWNLVTGLCWEDWVLRAECGLSLDDFPRGIGQGFPYISRKIYAPRNGHLDKVIFDDYLTEKLIEPVDFAGTNYVLRDIEVTDHLYQPIADPLKFRFDDAKEMHDHFMPENDTFYDHVQFIYD